MTTFEHGKAPAWACATWQKWGEYLLFYEDGKRNGAYATEAAKADRICRALSLAKLAEDWAVARWNHVKAVNRHPDPLFQTSAVTEAKRASDDAQSTLLKACES